MLFIPCVFGFHLILNIDSSSGNNKKIFTKLLKALFTIGIIQQKKQKQMSLKKELCCCLECPQNIRCLSS